ncbi:MAG: hypothetical protein PVJ67_05910 [Candidatus Pacearchaeota archaeon]|jgi:hypothetical protein
MYKPKFRRVILEYFPSPRFDEAREKYKFTLRGFLEFAEGFKRKSPEEDNQYKITLFDELCYSVGGTPNTIMGNEIHDFVRRNWDRRLSKIKIEEIVVVK